jgi:hypothetical protein
MSERGRILLALTPLVERAVEHDLFTRPTVEIVANAAEADELEGAIRSNAADAVLVSPDLAGITGAHCASARAAGLRVVGIALDEVGRDALNSLGVDETLTVPLEDGALDAAVRGPAAPRAATPAVERRPERRPSDGGSVVAVIGGKGAPGASACAASLAAQAPASWESVLVEVDALGSSLDVQLGADALEGSLAGLARAVQSGGADVRGLSDRWMIDRPGWSRVLLGAPEPAYDLASPGMAPQAIRALASVYGLVICDVGFLIALDDPEHSSSIARIHRETISIADAVVLVLGARDAQMRHGLTQLEALSDGLAVPPERLRIVVNGVGAPGASSRVEIEAALLPKLAERGIGVDTWLPWDRRALVQAQRRALPIASARPRGPYRRALVQLLDELFLPTAPVTRARRRLAPTTASATAPAAGSEEVALPWRR